MEVVKEPVIRIATHSYNQICFDKDLGGGSLYYKNSLSNCKLTEWDSVSALVGMYGTEKQNIEKVKQVLKLSRIVVSFNVSNETIKNFFVKNFEVYGVTKIPVGYVGGFQWYIQLRNTENRGSPYMRPTLYKKEDDGKPKAIPQPMGDVGVDKEKLRNILTETLKLRRRKTDIVDEVINKL